MKSDDLRELHFIAPIANVPSILEHGILCHRLAAKFQHYSIANGDVQERRANKMIPGAKLSLHDFANLYFDAHNPMLSRRRSENDVICVLRIQSVVMNFPGVIVSDCNAARGWARFAPAEEGLRRIDAEKVYAKFWLHENPVEQDEHKGIKCAEVLVPERIGPNYILGSYVANRQAMEALMAICALPTEIKSSMFF